MQPPSPCPDAECAQCFVEELLRTGLTLVDLLSGLLEDLPEDAFPCEQPGAALIEMLAGSVAPAVEAAGSQTVREATALLAAIRDRTVADLHLALERARKA